MIKSFIVILSLLIFPLSTCASHNLTVYSKKKISKSSKIALLPFLGDKHVRRPASEWFAYKLQENLELVLTPPASVELSLKKKRIHLLLSSNPMLKKDTTFEYIQPSYKSKKYTGLNNLNKIEVFSLKDLIRIGKILGVDYVISGYSIVRDVSVFIGSIGTIEIVIVDIDHGSVFALAEQSGTPNVRWTSYHDLNAILDNLEYLAPSIQNLLTNIPQDDEFQDDEFQDDEFQDDEFQD